MKTPPCTWHFVSAHPFNLLVLFDRRRGVAFAMLCARGVDFFESRIGQA